MIYIIVLLLILLSLALYSHIKELSICFWLGSSFVFTGLMLICALAITVGAKITVIDTEDSCLSSIEVSDVQINADCIMYTVASPNGERIERIPIYADTVIYKNESRTNRLQIIERKPITTNWWKYGLAAELLSNCLRDDYNQLKSFQEIIIFSDEL